MITSLVAVAATPAQPPPGSVLPAGPVGPGAYAEAVAEGFAGDRAAWLASLVGRGIQAAQIQSGRLRLTFTDGATADLGSIAGPRGQSTFEAWLALGHTGDLAAFMMAQRGADGFVRSVNGRSAADIALGPEDFGAALATTEEAAAGALTTGLMTPALVRAREAASLASGAAGTIGGAIALLAPSQSPALDAATLTGLTRTGSLVTTLDRRLTDHVPYPQPGDCAHLGRTTGSLAEPGLTFGYVLDFATTTGAAETGYARGKVALLVNNVAQGAGAGDAYTTNSVLTSTAGHLGHAINVEIDTNNLGAKGDTLLGDAAASIKVAEYFSGICTAGAPLSANTLVNLGHGAYGLSRVRGIYNGAVQGPIEEWACDASHGILAYGAYSVSLIDTRGATITGPTYFLRQNQAVAWAKADGTQGPSITSNAGNALVLDAQGGIAFGGNLAPTVDNAYSVGLPGVRATTVYAVTGVSSSSDVSLKTDVADIPTDVAMALVRALAPKIWRWRVGGADPVPTKTKVWEQATETVEGVERPLFDHEPVLGEDGRQIVDVVFGSPGRPEIHVPIDPGKPDGETAVIQEARAAVPDREVPRTRAVPRMVEVERDSIEHVARPGKRTHVGFLYQDVEAALARLAVDYGVCDRAKDPDGGPDRLFLRMERFTPLLWRVTQDLLARVESTEARLSAIEAKLKD